MKFYKLILFLIFAQFSVQLCYSMSLKKTVISYLAKNIKDQEQENNSNKIIENLESQALPNELYQELNSALLTKDIFAFLLKEYFSQNTNSFFKFKVKNESYVTDLIFSNNRKLLAIGLKNGTVKVINLLNNKIIFNSQVHNERVNSIRFSSDSKLLVTASSDGKALILNAKTGDIVYDLINSSKSVSHAEFSSDQKFVVVTCLDRVGLIYKLNILKKQKNQKSYDIKPIKLNGLEGAIKFANFSVDSKFIFILSSRKICVYSLENINETELEPIFYIVSRDIIYNNYDNIINLAKFTPDNKYLIITALDGNIFIYDISKNLLCESKNQSNNYLISIPAITHFSLTYNISFNIDGNKMLISCDNRVPIIYKIPIEKQELKQELKIGQFCKNITASSFSPDDNLIALSSVGISRIYCGNTGEILLELPNINDWIGELLNYSHFNKYGYFITLGYNGTEILVFDFSLTDLKQDLLNLHPLQIRLLINIFKSASQNKKFKISQEDSKYYNNLNPLIKKLIIDYLDQDT